MIHALRVLPSATAEGFWGVITMAHTEDTMIGKRIAQEARSKAR